VDTVRELFDLLGVEVQLRDLFGAAKNKVSDVYCPGVRRSPYSETPNLMHLDVVSCWRGLSYKQAAEIAYWEVNLQQCLEKIVRDAVIRIFAEHLRDETGTSLLVVVHGG
jgi:hypothetical protein